MNKLSIVLKSAAILSMLLPAAQNLDAQTCPKPYFCSRLSSSTAEKAGYAAYTDWLDGWDGVLHFYLHQDVVVSDSISFGSSPATSGSLSASMSFVVDAASSTADSMVQSWTNSSSANESGADNRTGALQSWSSWPPQVSNPGGFDWGIVSWHTTNYDYGTQHNGGFNAGSPVNHDLDDFASPINNGTQTFTLSTTVKQNNWVYNTSSENDSYNETMTLSVPYTDEMLVQILNAKIQNFTDDWTDPPTSLAASFSMTTNTDIESPDYGVVSAAGSKMQYRVVMSATEKGVTYRFRWFETTRDTRGNVTSKTPKTAAVVGTGNPGDLTLTEIITVEVPRQEGTVVEEDLTVQTSPPPSGPHSGVHSSPSPPAPTPGAGGR